MASDVDRHLFVIFGATGDLTSRKLIPALYRVMHENGVADRTVILGVSPTEMSDDDFREIGRSALRVAQLEDDDSDHWCDSRIFYQSIARDATSYDDLAMRIGELEESMDLPGNRVFYLALPPVAFEPVIEAVGSAGLHQAPGWARLVVEKPFGHDLASAKALNRVVQRYFDEAQVYRIDHYLGKETVRNLLTFRFANPIFETTWNRDRLEAVEITVAEELGVETRAGYYDKSGVIRDMVQNHLTQLMTLVAMEGPSSFKADAIRNEKVQVLESIGPIAADSVVLGRYSSGTVDGERVRGYLEEEGVESDSTTPTFAGLRLEINSWRWQGVPFYLRTGKRLPQRTTQIAITYKPAPICLFHGVRDDCPVKPNVVLLTLQPNEGFEIRFEVKKPGELGVVSKRMYFDYEAEFDRIPDAYQTLIYDVIRGDQTLFVRADEVEASWRLYDPLLEMDLPIHDYPAGTWGPAATNATLALWHDEWTMRG